MKNSQAVPPPDPEQLKTEVEAIQNVLKEGERENDAHRYIIAGANFVFGFLFLIVVPVVIFVTGIVGIATPPTPEGEVSPTAVVGSVAGFVTALMVFFALPFVLAGWALIARKSWATAAAVVAAVLHIPNLPLGTALAVYTFWAVAKNKLALR